MRRRLLVRRGIEELTNRPSIYAPPRSIRRGTGTRKMLEDRGQQLSRRDRAELSTKQRWEGWYRHVTSRCWHAYSGGPCLWLKARGGQ